MALRMLLGPCCCTAASQSLSRQYQRQFVRANPFVLPQSIGLRRNSYTREVVDLDPDNEYHPRDHGNRGLHIKCGLKHLGHKHWGFNIYRCTYGDDEAWSRFITGLFDHLRESLEFCGTPEIMESLHCPVHEDASVLDGARKDFVRQRFREWRSSPEAEAERLTVNSQTILMSGSGHGTTPRYTYCVHVDEQALRSNEPDITGRVDLDGYVNVINADWELPGPEEAEYMRQEFEIDDPFDEYEEPIEGCKMHDVGWMKVRTLGLMPSVYAILQSNSELWEVNYTRPPHIAAYW